MGNKYLRVSTASVKRLPCSLQFQNVLRMFNSKEPSDCKLIQPWDATISVTNVEHEPGWHHSRRHHQVSFPPTSLLVLASTRRHANRDTPSKAHWRLRSSNALIVRAQPTDQLSVPLQGCHRTTADIQHCHIWHIRPHPFPPQISLGSHSFVPTPSYLTADDTSNLASNRNDHKYSSTQHSTSNHTNHQDHQVPYACNYSLYFITHLLSHIVATGGGVL